MGCDVATTSIWSVKGWLGKVVIYVQNPDKTKNPEIAKLPELSGMEEKETQGLSDVIAYAVNAEKTRQRGKPEAAEDVIDDENEKVMEQYVSGYKMSRPNVQKILNKNVQLVYLF